MSWQLGTLGVLAVGLTAGFAWYERTRPDARMVALVGTLAALGALGRIAFAAVPNVKPTTDIVLVSGYVLGPGPGYVVGAVSALASNFFFGQGPWTPWQMAGWGATGVLGAVLARLTRGRVGRLPLALACFVVGFLFTALQDLGDWVTYSDHSASQLWAYVGKGIGFDLIHAGGCFAFAIVFAPGAMASLRRYRRRLSIDWLPVPPRGVGGGTGGRAPALLAGLVIAGGLGLGRDRGALAVTAARTPAQYLLSAENPDGGVGMAPGQPSSLLASGWQAMALDVSGTDTSAHSPAGGRGVIAYLAATVAQERGAGAIERTILAVSLAPHGAARAGDLGGRNLVAALHRLIERDGSVAGQTNLTAFAVLALRAARSPVPPATLAWLERQQDRDGGFNYLTAPGASDVDDTGAALSALAGANQSGEEGGSERGSRSRATLARAVAYLRKAQNRDGGFGEQPGAPSNAQSTALAVCGLIAAGIDPGDLHRAGSPSPLAYLRALIQPSGAVDYARGEVQTPVWVTAQAELALQRSAL